MPIYELDGQAPEFPADGNYWIAETAVLIGRVRLKSHASIWFGAVLRGDNEWIEIGERSQIQDNATLHTDPGFPMVIGANCVIGHKVMLHGCMVGDNSLIGMGAIAAQWLEDRQQLAGRRRRAGHRRQDVSRQFDDRRRARARHPHHRREGDQDDRQRRRHLRAPLAAIRQGPEADRLKKGAAGVGGRRPRANPVGDGEGWGRDRTRVVTPDLSVWMLRQWKQPAAYRRARPRCWDLPGTDA